MPLLRYYAIKTPCQVLVAALLSTMAQAASPPDIAYFEKHIRPLLVQHCYECHSVDSKKLKGGLRLDYRKGVLKGGDSGPSVIPGRVGKSLLIQAIRHSDPDLKMPPKKKLKPEQIEALEKWVAMGAPDPRSSAENSTEQKQLNLEAAKQFWAFLPVTKKAPPEVRDPNWPHSDIDRFILSAQEKKRH